MGKKNLNYCQSIVNATDLTLKQMFDISTKLVSEQDEISGLETNGWENHSWKYLSLIGDERIINLQRTTVYVFSDSVLCLGKILENPQSNDAWEQTLGWIKSSQNFRDFDRIDGVEFEWNIFQDSIRCRSVKKSKVYCADWEKSLYARRLGKKQWSFIGPGSAKRSGTPWKRTVHKEFGTISRKRC